MKQKLTLTAGCLVCLDVARRSFIALEGTEFGGGSLASNKDLGIFLFVLALILVPKYLRADTASALVAGLWSLPLYLYLVFPRPFRQIWGGNWKVMELPRESFIWDGWWVTGIVAIVFVAYICCRALIRSETHR
jgi:hypothetical protein